MTDIDGDGIAAPRDKKLIEWRRMKMKEQGIIFYALPYSKGNIYT